MKLEELLDVALELVEVGLYILGALLGVDAAVAVPEMVEDLEMQFSPSPRRERTRPTVNSWLSPALVPVRLSRRPQSCTKAASHSLLSSALVYLPYGFLEIGAVGARAQPIQNSSRKEGSVWVGFGISGSPDGSAARRDYALSARASRPSSRAPSPEAPCPAT